MRSAVMRVAAGAMLVTGLFAVPGGVAARAATVTQTCPVPIIGDPDSVTLNGPTAGPMGGPLATATVTAAETPEEQGPGAPTTRLYVFREGGANQLTDLLKGLMGPSTSGPVSLSGPASGKGSATESISVAAPGTYTFGFLSLFDNGIHPCTTLLGMAKAVSFTVR